MAMEPGLIIAQVRPGSLAEELELGPGDKITSINGQGVMDLVDFHFLTSDDFLEVEVTKADGEEWVLEVDKEPEEDFGVQFVAVSAQGIKHCRNKCLFCFVDQMPPNMRQTLYDKDDDYRLSLTQGSFITLTNLSEQELNRIVSLHLSPLYVSVHATDPQVREKLLRNPNAGMIMHQLQVLAEAGTVIHTQIVLVPGINDGEVLAKSISDLRSLWPQVQSVAVVPVGLTGFRERLAPLSKFHRDHARKVIEAGQAWQEKFRRERGVSFLYFSDEFYVEAGVEFPPGEHYDDYSQLENGVGLSRLFLDEIEAYLPQLPKEIQPRQVNLVTGVSAGAIMRTLSERICGAVKGLEITVHVLENSFFGSSVTVAGLLTGQDIIAGLNAVTAEEVLIPRVML
ncbi:MAG TPA: DUF512 domain-containing protein, partial [Verrucomicrobiae bacterium]|nr:DUF512 domain-containing protein [Verrucomicrobiae bacterium]